MTTPLQTGDGEIVPPASSSPAAAEEADEFTPLMPPGRGALLMGHLASRREGLHMDEIPPNGSIYNSILFIPPMARHRSGSYWTREVFLAFTLFFVTCLLQGGLTFITGRDILKRYETWVETLVDDVRHEKFEDWDTFHAIHHVEETSKYAWDGAEWVLGTESSKDALECCHGPECVVLDVPCCPPIPREANHSHRGFLLQERLRRNPVVLSAKPGGGKGDKGGDNEKAERQSPAICRREKDGHLDCAPPSVAYLDYWEDLDYDGNGVWTLEEAQADHANLACRLAVPTVDVFQNACRGLVLDARDTAQLLGREQKLPTSIVSYSGIPWAYFEWWQGIAAICVTTDAAFCGQLVRRGLFNGAMDPANRGRRGAVTNLDTTMSYCSRLLTPGGICDVALPGTYVLYRDRIHEKCGAGSFDQGRRYSNPFNGGDVMGTIDVEYEMHEEYKSTHGWSFMVFLCFILFLWYSNLIDEFKNILLLLDFVLNFPVDRQIDSLPVSVSIRLRSTFKWEELPSREMMKDVEETCCEDGSRRVDIRRISMAHWRMCAIMVLVRAVMLIYMCYAGTFFLLSNHTFIDLLLNSVALAFIFELDEFLFAFLVSEETKRELEECEPMHFASSFPQHGDRAALYKKGNWGLVLIPVLCILVVVWNDVRNTKPILEALKCACYAEGGQCRDNQLFSGEWWDKYWKDTSKLAA